jgi:hypothetical protein
LEPDEKNPAAGPDALVSIQRHPGLRAGNARSTGAVSVQLKLLSFGVPIDFHESAPISMNVRQVIKKSSAQQAAALTLRLALCDFA